MKTTYKKIITVFVLIGFILPFFAFSETGGNKYCSKIESFSIGLDTTMAEKQAKYDSKKIERMQNLAQKRAEIDSKRLANREKWDQNRDAHLSKLSDRATTTVQKLAVDTFKSEINKAVVSRRNAIDSAMKIFRDDIDRAILSRKSAVDEALSDFKDSLKGIMDNARFDCEKGTDQKKIKEDTKKAIEKARSNFSETIKEVEKKGVALVSLVNVKQAAFDKAQNDFKTAQEKAVSELKKVFKD